MGVDSLASQLDDTSDSQEADFTGSEQGEADSCARLHSLEEHEEEEEEEETGAASMIHTETNVK